MTWSRLLVLVGLAVGVGGAALFWFFVRGKVAEGDAAVALSEVIGVRAESVEMPLQRPFVGAEGVDGFGYPLRTADRAALAHLLRLGMYDELDRYLGEYQADFEADPKKEYWPIDAFESFGGEDPTIGIALDEWVETRPSSWAARMARGRYREGLGWFYRGGAISIETGLSRFRAMEKAFAEARDDLRSALEAKPKLVAAHRLLILMATARSKPNERREALDAALAVCPSCLQARVAYLHGLEPRWGGSHASMAAFAKSSQALASTNPRLRVLAGYVDLDRCREARQDERFEEGLTLCAPLERYAHWELDLGLAHLLLRAGKPQEAIELLDRALPQRPQDVGLLEQRARALSKLERWEELGQTMLTLRRLDVTDAGLAGLADLAVDSLAFLASQRVDAKQFELARAPLNLALLIHPGHSNTTRLLANLPAFQAAMTPRAALEVDDEQDAALTRLRDVIRERPDDFEARRKLDEALFRLNRFDEIVSSWDEYVARHPSDHRALLERAGTHTHRRDASAALADFDAACRLGANDGCQAASNLRVKFGR